MRAPTAPGSQDQTELVLMSLTISVPNKQKTDSTQLKKAAETTNREKPAAHPVLMFTLTLKNGRQAAWQDCSAEAPAVPSLHRGVPHC